MADSRFDEERPIVLDKNAARQGRQGLPVLYVLIGALTLALVAWAVMDLAYR